MGVLFQSRLWHVLLWSSPTSAQSDGVLFQNRLWHVAVITKDEPKVMECCSKTDFGMISRRGQYVKSDGVLLQNKPPGNSPGSQHDPADRGEMRLFGPDRTPLPRAGGRDYVNSQANSLKLVGMDFDGDG